MKLLSCHLAVNDLLEVFKWFGTIDNLVISQFAILELANKKRS